MHGTDERTNGPKDELTKAPGNGVRKAPGGAAAGAAYLANSKWGAGGGGGGKKRLLQLHELHQSARRSLLAARLPEYKVCADVRYACIKAGSSGPFGPSVHALSPCIGCVVHALVRALIAWSIHWSMHWFRGPFIVPCIGP